MAQSVTVAPASGHALLATQGGTGAAPGYDAIDLRRMMTAAHSRREGVFDQAGWRVRERSAGANMTLEVDANVGLARIDGVSIAAQGAYIVAPHSTVVALDVPGANVTNPRVDRIVLVVRDSTHDGSGQYDARVVLLPGQATTGASLDNRSGAQPVPVNALHLADVLVAANATAIPSTAIRDYRLYAGDSATPGDFKFSAGTGGAGWVPADLRALRRIVHARLFDEVGTRHGGGDGSITFNVPDLRGRVPIGAGGVTAGRLTAGDARGQTLGAEKTALAASELPPHNHPVNDPGHRHKPEQYLFALHRPGDVQTNTTQGQGSDLNSFFESQWTDTVPTGITVGNAGGGQAHSNMQPGLVEQWFVFTGSVAP